MNERIKLLAEQANIEFTYDPTETPMRAFAECWEEDIERFAELIVQECAEFADEHNEESEGVTLGVGRELKKHFGVEE